MYYFTILLNFSKAKYEVVIIIWCWQAKENNFLMDRCTEQWESVPEFWGNIDSKHGITEKILQYL